MPRYEFKCKICGCVVTQPTRELPLELLTGGCNFVRVWGFQYTPAMTEHYNPTTGSVVRTKSQFKDGLKQASERETARTGIPHNYVEVDPTDHKALGVTDEGLDATARRIMAEGKPTPKFPTLP